MTALPDDINGWTFETIQSIIEGYSGEPAWFDFKEVLNSTKNSKKHNGSIQRTACALANTDGGYIIFGVQDAQNKLAVRAIDRIVGIPESSELGKQLGDKLLTVKPLLNFVPSTRPIPHKTKLGYVVFPVYIPESPFRPHALVGQDGALHFYRRGDGGQAVLMEYHEVRDRMTYGTAQQRKVVFD